MFMKAFRITSLVASAVALILPGISEAGSLEPAAPPGPTMRTLDDIGGAPVRWDRRINDSTRFEIIWEGTAVLDHETGLVWGKALAVVFNGGNQSDGRYECARFLAGGRSGFRLPSLAEVTSLFTVNPATGERSFPFNSVFSWDSTYTGGTIVQTSEWLPTHGFGSTISGETWQWRYVVTVKPYGTVQKVGDVLIYRSDYLNAVGPGSVACVRGPQ